MAQACLIWSPVIIAELNNPQKVNEHLVYAVDDSFYSMEDIKVKTKNSEIIKQGKAIEANIVVDIICLLADSGGHMHLISKEEIIRQRVALSEFNKVLETDEQIEFWLNVMNLDWEGEFSGGSIRITLFLDYVVIATRQQIVRLSLDEEGDVIKENISEVLEKLEKEIEKLEIDNLILRKKVFLYERNISSLKKGINKVEKRNAILDREVRRYQELEDVLQSQIKHKNNLDNSYIKDPVDKAINQDKEEDKYPLSQAKKIKKMFLESI